MKNNDDISKTQPLYYRIVEKSQSTSDLTGLQFHLEDNIPKGINVSHHVLNDVMDAINDAFGSKVLMLFLTKRDLLGNSGEYCKLGVQWKKCLLGLL